MNMVFTVIGGIGLFLLGISLMTDGLKALAGNMLKQLLNKFTGGVFSSILSGATITAIIQSSSATTFMTIGFVSAGLLTFSQSVGVIIGANLGGSSTGWIVALIGLKISMGVISLPLIGIGVLLKMFSRERLAPHGMALAGFGLLFLGIDVLQQGMSGVGDSFQFTEFTGDTLFNKLILVVIGVVMTVIMQSSSAAVATTLAALATGTVTFDQAAVLAIGQNVGTTFKALIASLGGSIAAKQTATAHIMFNIMTGLIAFITLPLFISGVFTLSQWFGIQDAATKLALFHTIFNIVGIIIVILILPWFKKFIIWIVPNRGEELTKYLDPTVAEVPSIALESARRSLIKITKALAKSTQLLFIEKKVTPNLLNEWTIAENAILEVQNFLGKVSEKAHHMSRKDYKNHVSIIHAIDHLNRYIRAIREHENITYINQDENVKELSERLADICIIIEQELKHGDIHDLVMQVEENSKITAEVRRLDRERILKTSAKSMMSIDEAIQTVHTIHWIDRISFHLWRVIFHLNDFANHHEGEEETRKD